MKTKWFHPGAELIVPHQQGHLDTLCGLYALINAIRVLYAFDRQLTDQKCKALFAFGMDVLNLKPLGREAAHSGMTVTRQRRLAKALFESDVLECFPKIILGPLLPQVRTGADLNRALDHANRNRQVLLACLNGRLEHHTAITGSSASRIYLSDSDGLSFVLKKSFRSTKVTRAGLVFRGLFPISCG